MNVIVVDTSSWISYFEAEDQKDLTLGLSEGRVYLSPVVASELISGVKKQPERIKLIDFLKDLPLIGHDFDHWVKVGNLRSFLFSKGLTVSTPDAHVAQCAIDLDGYLLSEDHVFSKIAHQTELKILPQ